MDGSGRPTLRNRRFLRKIQPVCADRVYTSPPIHPSLPSMSQSEFKSDPPTCESFSPVDVQLPSSDLAVPTEPQPQFTAPNSTGYPTTPPADVGATSPNALRRSTRVRNPRQQLSMSMKGKSHNYIDITTSSPHPMD